MKLTLRAKGILAFTILVLYVAAVGFVLWQQSATLLRVAAELEEVYAQENALGKASYSVSHSSLKWHQTLVSSAELAPAFEEQVALDVDLTQAGLQLLLDFQPQLAADLERMSRDVVRLREEPSRSSMMWLSEHARELSERLDKITQQVRVRKNLLWDSYRLEYRSMAIKGIVLGSLGALAFGAAMTMFLTRLAGDIKQLAARAIEIVSGHRGPPVPITRHDEVGDLMESVNRMESELSRWEQQLRIAQEQRFHREKMAAIGSLAAAVAHEINNPIAAIVGIADSMQDETRRSADAAPANDKPQLILQQARRIAAISRQIAELTTPHPPEPQLLDVNTLVRNTCKFIGYDRRFEHIKLELQLDGTIPAVTAVADHLTQVLMNLVINAADALEDVARPDPTIWIGTAMSAGGEVLVTVEDNGKGMKREVLARAFENFYTTKPPHKGRGLGLSLCKSLIEDSGNRIELNSVPDLGTTARIYLVPRAATTGA